MRGKKRQTGREAEYHLEREFRNYDELAQDCAWATETVDLRGLIGGSEARLRFDCDDERVDRYLNTPIDLVSCGVMPDKDALAYWKRAQNTRKGEEY